jgi:hypothetical protein
MEPAKCEKKVWGRPEFLELLVETVTKDNPWEGTNKVSELSYTPLQSQRAQIVCKLKQMALIPTDAQVYGTSIGEMLDEIVKLVGGEESL